MNTNTEEQQYEICGVVAIKAWSVKVWIPAPLLILDSISWSHEMLDQALTLAADAWHERQFDEEKEQLRIAHKLKTWIEDDRHCVEDIPALSLRSRFEPRVVYRSSLMDYLAEVLEYSRKATISDTPQFLFDLSWSIADTKLYATHQVRHALVHAGSVPAELNNHGQLIVKLNEMRCPWDHW